MKNLNKIVLGLLFIVAWGCKKVEDVVVINPNASLTASISSGTVVLKKESAATDAVSVSWAEPDYGFSAAASYTVIIDKKGNNFAKPTSISVGSDLKKAFKTSELNSMLLGFGYLPDVAADLEIKVQSLIGAATVLTSPVINLKATPYSEKLDLSSVWGVVGDATPNGWDGPDLPMYKSTDVDGEFVAFVTLGNGKIKFRQKNDWAVNLGGSNGTLSAGGADISVTAGSYKITMNPTTLKYTVTSFTWGIVGDATTNGWNGPDQVMSYDPTVDYWRAVITVVDGKIKFRLNNDWGTNFGGAAGVLSNGGADISVTKGTYLVTADFKKLKYTVTAYKPWGIVGDATATGWGDKPDQKFTYDLSTERWVLNGVVLKDGQIKFRENDDWGNNLGSTASVEPDPIATSGGLKANGKNFGVTAGTWNFELDLKDANNPKYKATKVK